jgi:transcriptional regulator with XRE-family HTH domain
MTLAVVEEKQEILLKFGTRVRELRKAKGLSQEAFASLCGLDRTYISGIERGVRNVSIINIEALAVGLGVSLSELMERL